MKKIFFLIFLLGIIFLAGVADARSKPALVVIDNQINEKINVSVDGALVKSVSPREITNFTFPKVSEKMIFTVKFADGKGASGTFFINKGGKYSITISREDGRRKVVFQGQSGKRYYFGFHPYPSYRYYPRWYHSRHHRDGGKIIVPPIPPWPDRLPLPPWVKKEKK